MEEYDRIMKEGGYKLLDKTAYKISNNAVKFVDSITTNDMNKSSNAFITRLGRLIALVDQKVINDDVYVVLEEKYEKEFLDNLNIFIRISKSKAEKLNFKVVHVINLDIEGIKIEKEIGYLVLLDELDDLKGFNEISDEVYDIIRIENDISIQRVDYDNNMFLETNMDRAISYTKGCYVGQEIIARVHNLGKPAKKLVRILYDKIPEFVTIDGKKVGEITSKCFSPKYNKYLVFAMIEKFWEKIDDGEILS
ncbi:hypothetical protein HYX17_02060 [Candidatus Woesearchaeota archaeon]|nr:hypothetical protein [Candidatus Woesearchaeota archaeon]